MSDWTPEIVRELRAQDVEATLITPQNGTWLVGGKYILTTQQMTHLKKHGQLSLGGIEELDNALISMSNPS